MGAPELALRGDRRDAIERALDAGDVGARATGFGTHFEAVGEGHLEGHHELVGNHLGLVGGWERDAPHPLLRLGGHREGRDERDAQADDSDVTNQPGEPHGSTSGARTMATGVVSGPRGPTSTVPSYGI